VFFPNVLLKLLVLISQVLGIVQIVIVENSLAITLTSQGTGLEFANNNVTVPENIVIGTKIASVKASVSTNSDPVLSVNEESAFKIGVLTCETVPFYNRQYNSHVKITFNTFWKRGSP